MQNHTKDRIQSLRELLNHERNIAFARIYEYRAAQEQEAEPRPGDELETAEALSDVEVHASLIERAEERLRAIDSAFSHLEQGNYGVCTQCGEPISLERMKALPFAERCFECQKSQDRVRHVGEGTIDEPFAHQWDLPEEMAESTESSQDEFIAIPQEGPPEELPPSIAGLVATAERKDRLKRNAAGVLEKHKRRK